MTEPISTIISRHDGRAFAPSLELGPTALTAGQAVRLLRAAETMLGARTELLEVVRAGESSTSLEAAVKLLDSDDLSDVEMLFQHVEFTDGSEFVVVMSAQGIVGGTKGTHAGSEAREASRAVRAEYSAMDLRPFTAHQELRLQQLLHYLMMIGFAAPLVAVGIEFFDGAMIAMLLGAVLGVVIAHLPARWIQRWREKRRRHWLEREASPDGSAPTALAVLGTLAFAVTSVLVTIQVAS